MPKPIDSAKDPAVPPTALERKPALVKAPARGVPRRLEDFDPALLSAPKRPTKP